MDCDAIADKGYDADHLHEKIAETGAEIDLLFDCGHLTFDLPELLGIMTLEDGKGRCLGSGKAHSAFPWELRQNK